MPYLSNNKNMPHTSVFYIVYIYAYSSKILAIISLMLKDISIPKWKGQRPRWLEFL